MSETPFQAQRRTLRELKERQDAGEVAHPSERISPKAAKRRAAEAAAKPVAKKKKVSKKTSG